LFFSYKLKLTAFYTNLVTPQFFENNSIWVDWQHGREYAAMPPVITHVPTSIAIPGQILRYRSE